MNAASVAKLLVLATCVINATQSKSMTNTTDPSELGSREKGSVQGRIDCPHCGKPQGNLPNHLPCDGES